MDLHYLELFNTLAKELNYTKAAALLHISQPALSIQIKRLESQIGVPLFNKVGNRIYLNENGVLLSECTRKVFDLLNTVEHAIQNKQVMLTGSIAIGGSNTAGTYLLPRLIGSFQQLCPDVEIHLQIGNTDEIAQMVNKAELDFAVNGGSLEYPDYVQVERMMEDEIILAVSSGSRIPEVLLDKKDLDDARFIAHKTNSQLYKVVERLIQELKLNNKIAITFGSIDAIKQAVAADLGVSAIPISAVEMELKYGLIRKVTVPDLELRYPYSLINNKNRYLSPAAVALMDYVKYELQHYQINRIGIP